MKSILLLPFVLALPVFAGTSAKDVVAPAAAAAPCLFTWFTGASVGYLTELDAPMYNVHLGTDTCWKIAGWDVALFGEVGYTETDEDYSGRRIPTFQGASLAQPEFAQPEPGLSFQNGDSFSPDEMGDALNDLADLSGFDTGYDLDIMPLTFNVKLERQLTGNLNAYFGAGLGAALVNLDVNAGPFGDYSDDDWVFTAQVFAGVNYNFCSSFEVYSGVRWIYLQEADFSDKGSDATLDLEDDFLFELGARFNF